MQYILANIIIAGFSAFRFVVYLLPKGLELVTEIKINPKHYSNKYVREVAYKWTKAIRLMNLQRLLFAGCVVYGGDKMTNFAHLVLSFLFDVWLLWTMHFARVFEGTGGAIRHRRPYVPKTIQLMLVLTECVMLYACHGHY